MGDWKYVKAKKSEQLFNLAEDVGEQENLAKQNPEKTKQFTKRLATVHAELSGNK